MIITFVIIPLLDRCCLASFCYPLTSPRVLYVRIALYYGSILAHISLKKKSSFVGHFAKFIRINGAFNWEKGRFQMFHILLHLSKNGIYRDISKSAKDESGARYMYASQDLRSQAREISLMTFIKDIILYTNNIHLIFVISIFLRKCRQKRFYSGIHTQNY